MNHAINDVVWLRVAAKAAVVKAVHKDRYDVRSYDGETFSVKEKDLGRE